MNTYTQNLNLAFHLGHANGTVYVPPPNKLHSNLLAVLAMQAQFDLAELSFAECLEEEIGAKLGDCSTRMGIRIRHGGRMRINVAIDWRLRRWSWRSRCDLVRGPFTP